MLPSSVQTVCCCFAVLCAAVPDAVIGAQDKSGEPEAASPVVVAEVVSRQLAAGQPLVGTVQPARRSLVGSAVEGRVVDFPVRSGQAVRANQPLARLRTTTLEITLRGAHAELAGLKARLQELRNGSLPEEIEQSAAELVAAKALLTLAKSRYDRTVKLYAQKAANEEQLQDALAAWERARGTQVAADARHRLLQKGARPEQIAAAEADVAAQAEQVHLLEEQIERHTVLAPFDGYVSAERTQVGQWLTRGDAVAEVIELTEVEVEVFVVEKYLASVKPGLDVQVSVPAIPSEFFTGRIHRIVPQADVRSRSFPVRIRVRNSLTDNGPVLKSGMLARVEMPLGDPRPALLVDKDAVVLGGPEPLVFVLDGSARKNATSGVRGVPVRLGVMDGDLIEVTGALQAGQHVVIRGNERLKSGQKVAVAEVRAAGEGASRGPASVREAGS